MGLIGHCLQAHRFRIALSVWMIPLASSGKVNFV